jgi:hypothetical protein
MNHPQPFAMEHMACLEQTVQATSQLPDEVTLSRCDQIPWLDGTIYHSGLKVARFATDSHSEDAE